MSKVNEIQKHPRLRIPRAPDFFAPGRTQQEMIRLWENAHIERKKIIENEKYDHLAFGWEPPIWKVCDALLGLDLHPDFNGFVDHVWAERVRTNLGFKEPVKVLLILGGNRSGKTQRMNKRTLQVLFLKDRARAWMFHQKRDMSVEFHQNEVMKMMPPDLRGKDIKSKVTYIAHKEKVGFAEDSFRLPNGSSCFFKFYTMDKDNAIEGGELDRYAADELIPPDWVDTLFWRLVTRAGHGEVAFTPVNGYTATVAMFCDGAEVVLEEPGFMTPRDGGGPDVARALGFVDENEMELWHRDGCWSKPREIFDADGNLTPIAVPKREPVAVGGESKEHLEALRRQPFKMQPRILKSVDERMAVVHFYSSDNPYGNPKEIVADIVAGQLPQAMVEERFYGVANKTVSARFPKFNRKVHVIDPEKIPEKGTNYLIIDPAKGRNFFMKWYRRTRDSVYLYREWPSQCYAVPGQGVPGPWALPDGKKLDGKPGPAQAPFGFGLIDYVSEIARLEGWKNYEKLIAKLKKGFRVGVGKKVLDGCEDLDEVVFEIGEAQRNAREVIELRLIDSRAASEPKVENDRPVTLQTELEDLGLDCGLTPGLGIDEGVDLINDALAYDEEQPIGYLNSPLFYVSSDCKNSIYSLSTWTGADGNKGACKDPIDCDRYFFTADLDEVDVETEGCFGGGHY